jgi:hypothetical protein
MQLWIFMDRYLVRKTGDTLLHAAQAHHPFLAVGIKAKGRCRGSNQNSDWRAPGAEIGRSGRRASSNRDIPPRLPGQKSYVPIGPDGEMVIRVSRVSSLKAGIAPDDLQRLRAYARQERHSATSASSMMETPLGTPRHPPPAAGTARRAGGQKEKREALCRNGFTLPVTAEQLIAEAERTARHSNKLTRDMKAAGQARPADAAPGSVSAHHVVAATDLRADESRKMLFRWNIGINDVDNGVYLPAHRKSTVASLPNASKHAVIHTDLYHLNVLARLMPVPGNSPQNGRPARRQIKQELVDGVFPY